MLEMILDYEQSRANFQGQATLIDTREGVRCRDVVPRDASKQPERQAHPDQLLAVLAELGVPLSYPVRTAGGLRSVQHLLQDTLANFDPKQREIEWSALAFSLYLPRQRSWVDKYGTVHTFDDLAKELMARPFTGNAACGGTHLLYSLTVMLRADHMEPFLGLDTRKELRSHLARLATGLVRTQSADGTYGLRWHEQIQQGTPAYPGRPGGTWSEVLVTGHHLEWLMLLPPDLLPPRDCFLRATRWLQVRLLAASDDDLLNHYCPFSHAARTLILLMTPRAHDPGRGSGSLPRGWNKEVEAPASAGSFSLSSLRKE
jgi:hypothetical protein